MSEPVEHRPSMEDAASESCMPELDMEFESDEKAYQFYNNYAKEIGFSVRKQNLNRSASGQVRSRRYVCHREGYRRKNRSGNYVMKSDKRDERTGCLAHMDIKISYTGAFRVCDFEPKHNHALVPPTKTHLLRSQKLLNKVQTSVENLANDSGIPPKAATGFPLNQTGGCSSLPADDKNYLPSKRKNAMKLGDSGEMIKYLRERQAENSRFFYAIQLDEDDRITNIFWADARSRVDYDHFGDVVCLDMTFRTNGYVRPFAPFVGVNHHKQIIIFAAALLYDETEESFKWLFEIFKQAMSGKKPQVILMDHDVPISNALSAVWPGTVQRLCVWHMYQNALKHLSEVFQGSESFKHDFGKCVYDYEDDEDFLLAWQEMLKKYSLTDNAWLAKLFDDKEKWALPYGRETFCADMKSMQQNESLNRVMKRYLSPEQDLMTFFQHYDNLLEDRRYRELEADFRTSQTTPKVPHSRLLKQAAIVYTAEVYEMFEREFGLYVDCTIHTCGEVGTVCDYEITNDETSKTSVVTFDSSNGRLTCTCKKFEFIGIQCCHVLKVLDYRNIKELPEQYLLKRWRKDAKSGIVSDSQVYQTGSDPKIALTNRYNSLGHIYNQIVARASESEEAYEIAIIESVMLMEKVKQPFQKKVNGKRPINSSNDHSHDPAECEPPITTSHQQSSNTTDETNASQDNDKDGRTTHRKASEKKNKDEGHGHHKSEMNKRKRGRKDNEQPVAPRGIPYRLLNSVEYSPMQIPASSPFMQIGLGLAPRMIDIYQQGNHGLTQFSQESSVNLQQESLCSSVQLSQDDSDCDIF